jgi:selenocysteine lyase/cysteine desulfurase
VGPVHYNTRAEVDAILIALDEILPREAVA